MEETTEGGGGKGFNCSKGSMINFTFCPWRFPDYPLSTRFSVGPGLLIHSLEIASQSVTRGEAPYQALGCREKDPCGQLCTDLEGSYPSVPIPGWGNDSLLFVPVSLQAYLLASTDQHRPRTKFLVESFIVCFVCAPCLPRAPRIVSFLTLIVRTGSKRISFSYIQIGHQLDSLSLML